MEYVDVFKATFYKPIDQSLTDLKLDYDQLLNRCQKIAVNYYRNHLVELYKELGLNNKFAYTSKFSNRYYFDDDDYINFSIDKLYSTYKKTILCTLDEVANLAECAHGDEIDKKHPDLLEKFKTSVFKHEDALLNEINCHPNTKIKLFSDLELGDDECYEEDVEISLGLSVPVSVAREVFLKHFQNFPNFKSINGLCSLNNQISQKILNTLTDIVIDKLNERYNIDFMEMLSNTLTISGNGPKFPFWEQEVIEACMKSNLGSVFSNSFKEWQFYEFYFTLSKTCLYSNTKNLFNKNFSRFDNLLTLAQLVQHQHSTDRNLVFPPPNL